MSLQRIYLGASEDEALVLRNLFDLLGPERDQRLVVWVPGERAVDVPDDVAEKYIKAETAAAKKATAKAAKAPAAPPADSGKQEE